MNERSLQVLEYPKVVQLLKNLTTFPPGAERAQALHPTPSRESVSDRLEETAEAVRLLEEGGSDPLRGARDVRTAVGRAAREGVLTGPELLDVAQTATVMARCRRLLSGGDPSRWPRLAALAEQMGDFRDVVQKVGARIGDDGVVLDRASDKLARLRSQIRTWQARSRERLEAVLRAADARQALQEAIVTVRNDRYVVPVKVEYKGSVPGIVHDTSSSGATIFVEPLAVVEINNKVKQAQADEAREVERILRELSGVVGDQAPALLQGLDALARFDVALAKARLAANMEAVRPVLNDVGRLELRGARHPLLTGDVVPVDVWLGRDFRVLVITGPNTGGKTVTLKTIGLFCLMAQAGLFVPAERAELPVYAGVFADIGDEQSIEQSLSTFSGHMANIVDILEAVDEGSLVLLDELGAGTDPAEGAALAMAILQHLAGEGVSTVATTHYSELKSFVHGRSDMQNASVEFDPDTLAPTYRLIMGTPGRSNALEIAARLGLPENILAAARGQFSEADDVRVEDLLRDLETARREARDERERARRLRKDAQELRDRLERTEADLRAKRDLWEREARDDARRFLTGAREEIEAIIADLRRRGDDAGVEQARRAHRRVGELQRRGAEEAPRPTEPSGDAESFAPRIGDDVHVRTLGQTGRVLSGPDGDGQWTVQVGPMRVVVSGRDLGPPGPASRPGPSPRSIRRSATGAAALQPSKRAAVSPELNVRGLIVEDALHELEKYLDDALLAGLDQVLVIHGKGTGALRRAVHDYAQSHPHVKRWRLAEPRAGGDGATVLEL